MATTSEQQNDIFDRLKRCINCGLLVRNLRRYSLEEASDSMINVLTLWIAPTQLSSECIICGECFELLRKQADTMNEQTDLKPSPAFGHKQICFPCGHSILRLRTHAALQDRVETKYWKNLLPQHLASRMERVCFKCWLCATRKVKRQKDLDLSRTAVDDAPSGTASVPVPPPLPPPPGRPQTQVTPKIISAVYTRAANTANHCVFPDCFNTERLLIPSLIKDQVLVKQKFYIPPSARVCLYHKNSGSWKELTSHLRDFTGAQFDNMMSMMQRSAHNLLNFSDISSMPEHLCQYWFGMDSERFYDFLNSIPNLADQVPNATLALSIYLVKFRTGDTNERLATLFDMPRSTLERYMKQAKICLNSDETF